MHSPCWYADASSQPFSPPRPTRWKGQRTYLAQAPAAKCERLDIGKEVPTGDARDGALDNAQRYERRRTASPREYSGGHIQLEEEVVETAIAAGCIILIVDRAEDAVEVRVICPRAENNLISEPTDVLSRLELHGSRR